MITRSFLKNLATKAHPLSPFVIIGGNGLTIQVHNEIEAALIKHELIKIRINADSRDEREEMIKAIIEKHNAVIVQKIGHILVIYRNNEK